MPRYLINLARVQQAAAQAEFASFIEARTEVEEAFIMIAHRLSTVQQCDRVIRLEPGIMARNKTKGSHLLKPSKYYLP